VCAGCGGGLILPTTVIVSIKPAGLRALRAIERAGTCILWPEHASRPAVTPQVESPQHPRDAWHMCAYYAYRSPELVGTSSPLAAMSIKTRHTAVVLTCANWVHEIAWSVHGS
jgi:hypothetical protein